MSGAMKFVTSRGCSVFAERADALPVVGVGLSLSRGAIDDPASQQGLSRLLARAMRMGTASLNSVALEQRLDELGAQLSMVVGQSTMHFGGVVLKHNLVPFVHLLAELVLEPALRDRDIAQIKREALDDLVGLCDDDRTLAFRAFRKHAFGDHPYARSRLGTLASLRALRPADLRARHAQLLRAQDMTFGVWGDFSPRELRRTLDDAFSAVPRGGAARAALAEPTFASGRRIVVIDKPERSQTQIVIGTLATHPRERAHIPLIVANTAFGGLFTSRLNSEVRAKRGWSYGASSHLTQSLTRDTWLMHTYPAARDAIACIELQLSLYDRWVTRGLGARELRSAKSYLVHGHAFEVDTPSKRLDQRLEDALYNWPRGYARRFVDRVQGVTQAQVGSALRRHLSRADQLITLVATASELLPQLRALPGVTSVDVVPFDDI